MRTSENMIDESMGGRTGLGRRLQAFALAHCTGAYEALVAERKGRLLAPLRGIVVEIGPGTGANLRYYSPEVRWIGVEPNVHAHRYLDREIRRVGIDGKLMVGRAERLEMEDESVDAIVSTVVLCSVDDPVRSIAEIRRILKPGGRLVFIEHVAAADGTLLRAVQGSLNPVWRRLVDGCHLTRDTERTILKTGFSEVEVERFSAHAGPVAPHIAGWARK